jgi:cyclophilin family peptidyl-prolyl cis-trans isomerase
MAALTPDSIPDVADIREGLVATLERRRVPILAGLAVAVVGSLGLLAWSSLRREKADALRTELTSVIEDFQGHRMIYSFAGGEPQPDPDVAAAQVKKLEDLRGRVAGTDLEPQVLVQMALRYQALGQDEKVLGVLGELRSGFPEAPILRVQSFDSERMSLVDRIAGISKRRMEFASQHRYVDPKPDPAVSAVVETEIGTMKIVFYRDLAPNHVEAFIQQAKAGAFNGTRMYYARRGEYIELGGGDHTRNAELRDDREDDPELSLAPEDKARNGVKHRRRMVTSVVLLSGDQADRFAVVLSEKRPDFDALRTPFGELLDDPSATVADRLGSALVYGEDSNYIDRREKTDYPYTPSRPVVLRRVSIWKEGALEPGHTWDTSRVNTDQPEPEKQLEEKKDDKKDEKPK